MFLVLLTFVWNGFLAETGAPWFHYVVLLRKAFIWFYEIRITEIICTTLTYCSGLYDGNSVKP